MEKISCWVLAIYVGKTKVLLRTILLIPRVNQIVLVFNQAYPQNLSAFGFVYNILLPLMLLLVL